MTGPIGAVHKRTGISDHLAAGPPRSCRARAAAYLRRQLVIPVLAGDAVERREIEVVIQGGAPYVECAGDLTHVSPRPHRKRSGLLLGGEFEWAAAEPADGLGHLTAGLRALTNQLALKFRQGGEQVQLQLAVRSRRVDRLSQRSKRDVSLLEQRNDVDQVAQAAAEAIEPLHDERVAGAQVVQAGFELGALADRAGADVAEDSRGAGLLERVELKGDGPAGGWTRGRSRSVDRRRCRCHH